GRDRARSPLPTAEEAPRPLPPSDPRRREPAELRCELLAARRHQVEVRRAFIEPERRPVELVVADERNMLVTAPAREHDAVHRGMRGPRQALDLTEGREPNS